jgi:hypothetical protein
MNFLNIKQATLATNRFKHQIKMVKGAFRMNMRLCLPEAELINFTIMIGYIGVISR